MRHNPYDIIHHRHMTEKAKVLESLHTASSNQSVSKCTSPKYVFIVAPHANKIEIRKAIETIYPQVTVKKVHTLNGKPKKRRVKGILGRTNKYKKAVITLDKGDLLEDKV